MADGKHVDVANEALAQWPVTQRGCQRRIQRIARRDGVSAVSERDLQGAVGRARHVIGRLDEHSASCD